MSYIMQTENLTKTYGKKDAVKDININIREGEIYGLIGRNGAGKTTIMRMISGLSNPTGGTCSLFGKKGPEMKRMMNKAVSIGIFYAFLLVFITLKLYNKKDIK